MFKRQRVRDRRTLIRTLAPGRIIAGKLQKEIGSIRDAGKRFERGGS